MVTIRNTDLIYETENYDVILVGLTLGGCMKGGFPAKLAIKYPETERLDGSLPYGDTRRLGTRMTIYGKPIISLMYYVEGVGAIVTRSPKRSACVNYEALENCLCTADNEFAGMRAGSLLMGSTRYDGNGDKEKCMDLIRSCCKKMDLTVHEYNEISIGRERYRADYYIKYLKYVDFDKYCYATANKERLLKKLYLA